MIDGAASAGDRDRLRRVLGTPAWAWLRQRLRSHFESGREPPRRLRLASPSILERQAANALFAMPGATGAVQVPVVALQRVLREAALPDDLRLVLEICDGPLIDRPAEQRNWVARWQAVVDRCTHLLADRPGLATLADPRFWQRCSAGDPVQAEAWITQLARLFALLPRPGGWHLQELAACIDGDAHSLDRGCVLGRLALLAAGDDGSAGGDLLRWRAAWAALGVRVPQTTAPVLCLGLRWRSGPFADCWNQHAVAGEPLRLTLRTLLTAAPAPVGRIFCCENPCIVEAAAERLGAACAPMICLEGQATSAAVQLLAQCVAEGAELWYHGDFDWPGLTIGNALFARFPTTSPWRFSAADLQAAAAIPGPALEGESVAASWDGALAPAMLQRGRALHEEALLDLLLGDLADGGRDADP